METLRPVKSWYALFFGSFRRQPTARQFRYKDSVPKVRNAVLQDFRLRLKEKGARVEQVENVKAVERLPLKSVQELLVRDIKISLNGPAILQFVRADITSAKYKQPQAVSEWAHIAPIFMNPLDRTYRIVRDAVNSGLPGNVSFEFENNIRLVSEDGSEELRCVAWPALIYSLSCHGLGVSPEVFKRLSGTEVVNPADGTLLKIHEFASVPKGCDAIGLFPAYVESHKKLFSGLQLFASLIRRKACSGAALSRMEKALTNPAPSGIAPVSSNVLSDEAISELDFSDLKDLMSHIKKYKLLWSRSKDKNKICPGDIIRCTLSSKSVTATQLEQEFCKHYILFSALSQTIRMKEHLVKDISLLKTTDLTWTASDYFMLQCLQDTNKLEVPSNARELVEYKNQYDNFLGALTSYYFTVMAEMKSLSRDFYPPSDGARALPTFALLTSIFHECEAVRIFHPNVHYYFTKMMSGISNQLPLLNQLTLSPVDVAAGRKLNSVITSCIELEHTIYADDFSTETPIELEPVAPIRDWKLVVMSKDPFSSDDIRIIQFNSRIYTQFVTDLSEVTRKSFSICKARRMIDEDTFIFLYKLQKPKKVDREELVSRIIEKLDNAASA